MRAKTKMVLKYLIPESPGAGLCSGVVLVVSFLKRCDHELLLTQTKLLNPSINLLICTCFVLSICMIF